MCECANDAKMCVCRLYVVWYILPQTKTICCAVRDMHHSHKHTHRRPAYDFVIVVVVVVVCSLARTWCIIYPTTNVDHHSLGGPYAVRNDVLLVCAFHLCRTACMWVPPTAHMHNKYKFSTPHDEEVQKCYLSLKNVLALIILHFACYEPTSQRQRIVR